MKLSFSPSRRGFTFLDAMGLLGGVGLLAGRYLALARLPFWGCEVRRLTGWPCPGCGLTRAADRLAHFHLKAAFLANPVGALAGVLFALAAVYALVHRVLPLPEPQLELSDQEARRARIGLVVLLVLNWAFVAFQTRLAAGGGG